jgi:hypothetical protein
LDGGFGQARAEKRRGAGGGEIRAGARACVVGVRVGDEGMVDGAPGIDVKAAGWTVEAVGREFEQRHSHYYEVTIAFMK